MAAGELIRTEGLLKAEWNLVPNQSRRMKNSGNSIVGVFGPSEWKLTVETRRLSMAEARLWSVWIDDRKEFAFTFTAFRLFRVNPQGALGTPDGSIGLAVDDVNSELDLTGTGAYVATKGDMISYRTANNGYYAGQIREDATAVAGAVTVKVSPRPLAKHATVPAVRRVQALAEFELTTDPGGFEDYIQRGVSFEAMQVPR